MKRGSQRRRKGHLSVSNSLFFYFGICISFPLDTNKLISYQDEYHISVITYDFIRFIKIVVVKRLYFIRKVLNAIRFSWYYYFGLIIIQKRFIILNGFAKKGISMLMTSTHNWLGFIYQFTYFMAISF